MNAIVKILTPEEVHCVLAAHVLNKAGIITDGPVDISVTSSTLTKSNQVISYRISITPSAMRITPAEGEPLNPS